MLPGPVELDETLVYRTKKSRALGRVIRIKIWLIGIKCRVTKRFVLYPTRFRDRNLVLRILQRHVQPNAVVFTDCFSMYVNNRTSPKQSHLSQYGYLHIFINHKRHFVSHINNSIHTNTIERVWGSLKKFIRLFNPRFFVCLCLTKYHFCEVYDEEARERIIFLELARIRKELCKF